MTKGKKFLKFLAVLLALILSVGIISAVLGAIASVALVFDIADNVGDMELREVAAEYDSLDIKLSGARLIIQNGEKFSVETNIPGLVVKDSAKTLVIKQRDLFGGLLDKMNSAKVVITVPEGTVFDSVSIKTESGRVDMDSLAANDVDFEFGAGEVKIEMLTVTERATINGGVGRITVEGGEINGLDLTMGVGELELNARLRGVSYFDMGVGKADVKLIGEKTDYKLEVEKGVGAIKISDSKKDTGIYGDGEAVVKIEGGVGTINVTFAK